VSRKYILIPHFVEASIYEIFPRQLLQFLVCLREKSRILEVVINEQRREVLLGDPVS
jgi:hypothetical protein